MRERSLHSGEGGNMKLSVRSLAMTTGIVWGGTCFLVALANLVWPGYGGSFLDLMSSVYPGYRVTGTAGSVVVGTLYALLDGLVGGALFAWIYNFFVR
jgi:hypothetical protein